MRGQFCGRMYTNIYVNPCVCMDGVCAWNRCGG